MKRIISFLFLCTVLLFSATTATAQHGKRGGNREHFAETQARQIANRLNLDEGKTRQLVDTYKQYYQEVWELKSQQGKRGNHGKEADQVMQDRFDRSQKLLNLRKKYYHHYQKFLTNQQIMDMYDLERDMFRNLQRNHRR